VRPNVEALTSGSAGRNKQQSQTFFEDTNKLGDILGQLRIKNLGRNSRLDAPRPSCPKEIQSGVVSRASLLDPVLR